MSGKGVHFLYKIDDSPVTEALIRYIQNFLKFLASCFNSDKVSVDTSVYNPARICRLYGTTARKGDPVPQGSQREARPHQSSYIANMPEPLEPVSEEALHKVFLLFPKEPEAPTRNAFIDSSNSRVNVAEYLTHYGIKFKTRQKNGSTFYCLDSCIFDSGHKNNDAAVLQTESGVLLYQCFHASCQGRQWRDARELISGNTSLSNFMNG